MMIRGTTMEHTRDRCDHDHIDGDATAAAAADDHDDKPPSFGRCSPYAIAPLPGCKAPAQNQQHQRVETYHRSCSSSLPTSISPCCTWRGRRRGGGRQETCAHGDDDDDDDDDDAPSRTWRLETLNSPSSPESTFIRKDLPCRACHNKGCIKHNKGRDDDDDRDDVDDLTQGGVDMKLMTATGHHHGL
jgi:hypothetical protein